MAKHYAEGSIIHCDGPDGNDYTLCGFSLDGEGGDDPLQLTKAKINCDRCINLIDFCRGLSLAEKVAPKLQLSRHS